MNWALLSTAIMGLSILAFFWRYERSQASTKGIAIVATLSALAAVSRIAFSPIASFKPTTFIIMISGYVFGAQTGFMVGAVTALVSNFFLGQGAWTPWQMLCWGLCGVLAGLLGSRQSEFKLVIFTLLAGLCGYLFGFIMNIWHWVAFVYPLTLKTFGAVYAAGFAFDSLHAAGNIVFSIIFGPAFYKILRRFKKYI
jgi:energy-coupling factor transport system substrate-specific component